MIALQVKFDIRALSRQLDNVAKKQLRFAASQALNAIGRAGIEAERAEMAKDLDKPKPFTVTQGLRLRSATKSSLSAMIVIPPIQAAYLSPEIYGGKQVLNRDSRAVLVPIDQATNQYGNLPRKALARLKGRPDIFIGAVKTKTGVTNGVWQRVVQRSSQHGRLTEFTKRKGAWIRRKVDKTAGEARGLRLLIRFADPVEVKTRYPFGQAALATATALFPAELARQLAQALRTAAR